MRAIAEDLGVAPNALYSHVASKSALVDDLLDDVLADVAEPTSVDPATAMREVMVSTYEVLLTPRRPRPGLPRAPGIPRAERAAARRDHGRPARPSGLDRRAVGEARRALIVYTIGFAAFAGSRPPLDSGRDCAVPPDRVARHFIRGLDWLLAGISARPAGR